MDRTLDEVEQYNRNNSLILGGAFPDGEDGEMPSETRETVKKIIKEKLKVELKGEIVACPRLRNNLSHIKRRAWRSTNGGYVQYVSELRLLPSFSPLVVIYVIVL